MDVVVQSGTLAVAAAVRCRQLAVLVVQYKCPVHQKNNALIQDVTATNHENQ